MKLLRDTYTSVGNATATFAEEEIVASLIL